MDTIPTLTNINASITFEGKPSKTYIIDHQSNQVVKVDDGIESVTQAIDIILNTERYYWQIYSKNSGIELNNLIGKDFEFVGSELLRRLNDAFKMDDRITGVENYKFARSEQDFNSAVCTFDVMTVFGAVSNGLEVQIR